MTAPTITRILDGLEESGFIMRTPSSQDRRVVHVAATAQGRGALEKARARQLGRVAEDVARLTPAERARVADAMGVIEKLGRSRDSTIDRP